MNNNKNITCAFARHRYLFNNYGSGCYQTYDKMINIYDVFKNLKLPNSRNTYSRIKDGKTRARNKTSTYHGSLKNNKIKIRTRYNHRILSTMFNRRPLHPVMVSCSRMSIKFSSDRIKSTYNRSNLFLSRNNYPPAIKCIYSAFHCLDFLTHTFTS